MNLKVGMMLPQMKKFQKSKLEEYGNIETNLVKDAFFARLAVSDKVNKNNEQEEKEAEIHRKLKEVKQKLALRKRTLYNSFQENKSLKSDVIKVISAFEKCKTEIEEDDFDIAIKVFKEIHFNLEKNKTDLMNYNTIVYGLQKEYSELDKEYQILAAKISELKPYEEQIKTFDTDGIICLKDEITKDELSQDQTQSRIDRYEFIMKSIYFLMRKFIVLYYPKIKIRQKDYFRDKMEELQKVELHTLVIDKKYFISFVQHFICYFCSTWKTHSKNNLV